MNYKKINLNYLDIPYVDMPSGGGTVVCKDPQHRLGRDNTWAVVRTFDNKEASPKALGLFWDEKEADRYAKCITKHSR